MPSLPLSSCLWEPWMFVHISARDPVYSSAAALGEGRSCLLVGRRWRAQAAASSRPRHLCLLLRPPFCPPFLPPFSSNLPFPQFLFFLTASPGVCQSAVY